VWYSPDRSSKPAGELRAILSAEGSPDALAMPGSSADAGDRDHVLLKAVRGGDVSAFEELYRRNFQAVRAFVLCRARVAASIDDLTQETFARLWQHRTRYAGGARGRTYLLGVTINVIREDRRRGNRIYNPDLTTNPPRDAHQDGLSEPEHAAALADQSELIARAKQSLSAKQQEAIELVYVLELPGQEAAECARCSYDAFRRRLCVAKKLLKRAIEQLDPRRTP
jgi:RNA polymerase sigma-70 factor (ECF subfamily)